MSEYGYLMHHGVKGMRWGVRNYQNADGSLTAEGRARYYNADGTRTKAGTRYEAKQYAAQTKAAYKEAKTNLKNYRIQSLKKVAQRGPIKGAAAYISGSKGLKTAVKNASRDRFVAGNVWNTSKYKLKYRDADEATKVKMARLNRVKTAAANYATSTAIKMLARDTVNAAVATYAQKGQRAMSGPQVAALFVKNMGTQINNRIEKVSKAVDTAANIGKRVKEDMDYRKANRATKKGFGSYREIPWGYLPGK